VAINIKDADTDRLARELAALTGEPITEAVRTAIELRLAALRRRAALSRASDLDAIVERGRARPMLDRRGVDEILGYGDDGLPA
jgi:antitoxin VapB